MKLDSLLVMSNELQSLLFPLACLNCERPIETTASYFCDACTNAWTSDTSAACPRCGSAIGEYAFTEGGCPKCFGESFRFEGLFRLGRYRDDLRMAVLRLKKPRQEAFAHRFAIWWASQMKARLISGGFDAVLPVPLHWIRRWQRGFNQSEFLAEALARELNVPLLKGLKRTKRVADQKLLGGPERRKNLRDAFRAVTSINFKDRRLLLVDDVSTSGATASACARILRDSGAKEVHVAVIAKG